MFKRALLAAAAALALAGTAHAQSAVNPIVTLSQGPGVTTWQDLGAGPQEIAILYGGATINFGTTSSCAAVPSSAGGTTLQYKNGDILNPIPLYTTLHICAKVFGSAGAQLLTFPIGAH